MKRKRSSRCSLASGYDSNRAPRTLWASDSRIHTRLSHSGVEVAFNRMLHWNIAQANLHSAVAIIWGAG
jgi:hypothetical protein